MTDKRMFHCVLFLFLLLLQVSLLTADGTLSHAIAALKDCHHNGPLGMTTGRIQDSQITASSNYPPEWDKGCQEKYARVYQPNGVGWCAKFKSSSEWLQVDLGVPAKVTGLMTQGRGDGTEWVTSFLVSYSVDAYHWLYVTDQYGNQRVFEGNTDSYSVKHVYLDDAIIARYLKFHTSQWHRHPSLRVEVIGCQACRVPIGLPPYGKVTASTEKSSDDASSCQANDAFIITNKAWCAKLDNSDQWLQFDIGPPTLVTGLVTKGRGENNKKHWVTKYRMSYSNDSRTWHFYRENAAKIKEFQGNVDKDTDRYNFLTVPFVARFVRFHPTAWHRHISMRAGLLGCPYLGECYTGFMRVNDYTPCVENLAYRKESFINSRRTQYKRHVQSQWAHAQAARAVDGGTDQTIHSCTVLDNFYVEKPVWMVDLGRKTTISGVVIMTWIDKKNDGRSRSDYMHNLERLTVYVSPRPGGVGAGNASEGEDGGFDAPQNTCGFLTRLNDALLRPRLHVSCGGPMKGRYVYVEATGVTSRQGRLFGAVLCEVLVYE